MCCVLYHLYLCTCVVGIATVSQTLELSFKVNCFSPHSTILSTNEQGAPSESYLQEVREQLEERWEESEENQHQRETRSASDNTGKVCISEQYSQSLATLLDLWL